MNIGALVLLPVILVILTAVLSRRVTEALLLGSISSYIILAIVQKANPVTLMVDSLFGVLTDYDTIWVIVVSGLLGSLIAIMNEARCTHAVAKALGKICKSERSVLFVSWILGCLIFLDDYMNILTISACTRKLADQRKSPREALAYVIDSTGAPACVLLPYSAWAIFFAGVFYESSEVVDLGYGSAIATYIHTIPYMYYAMIALLIVPLFIFGVIPKVGAMKKAYRRVEETGMVYSEASKKYNQNEDGKEDTGKAKILDFILPIAVMIAVQLISDDLFVAVIASLITTAILYLPRRLLKVGHFCDLWVSGFAEFTPAFFVIVAAFWMKEASAALHLPEYIIHFVEPMITPQVYPMIAFIVVALLGFITSSNWGIPAVCAPILIPLGATVGANLLLVMAAIVCGGTFCSHACFYSDATVITSQACGIDNMDHVYTQLPYALLGGVLASIAFLIAGFLL